MKHKHNHFKVQSDSALYNYNYQRNYYLYVRPSILCLENIIFFQYAQLYLQKETYIYHYFKLDYFELNSMLLQM